MNKRLLFSLAVVPYVTAFIAGGCELVAHTGGDLAQTVICGTIVGFIGSFIVGGIVYCAADIVCGWWDWVKAG